MDLSSLPAWLLPILIFVAEMAVVTLGTLRIIFVSRGRHYLAPVLGFFEVVIWLFAIGQVMMHLHNGFCFLAFAFGFMVGNFLGILTEKKLALGMVQVRIITPRPVDELLAALRRSDFGATCLKGEGANGPVHVVVSVVRRKHRHDVIGLVKTFQPGAFYSVEEIQAAGEGIFPPAPEHPLRILTATLPFRTRRAWTEEKCAS